VWGVQTDSKQHYRHQFYLLIACTLVSLLLQLMLLLTEAHSPYSTTQGLLDVQSFTYICFVFFFSFPTFLDLVSASWPCNAFFLFAGHVLQNLSFIWLDTVNLSMGRNCQLAWGLGWCLKQRSRVSVGNLLNELILLHIYLYPAGIIIKFWLEGMWYWPITAYIFPFRV